MKMGAASARRGWVQLATLAVVVFGLLGLVKTAHAASPGLVISQIYGGGGNAGATLKQDFVELFNRGPSPISVSGWSVQYASSAGTTWQVTTLSGTIQPGRYYLIQQAQGAGGSVDLPAPVDAAGTTAMSATSGKVALVSSTTALSGACPSSAAIVDLVGFGTAASCSEGNPTPNLTAATAATRLLGGCTETDSNSGDFGAPGTPAPRNATAPFHSCGETAPAVSGTTPSSGAVNVSTTSALSVSFSEAVDVTAGAVTVECPAGTLIGANPSALSGVTNVVVTPPSDLPLGTACRIVVTAAGIRDSDLDDPPDAMPSDFSAGFTTLAATTCSAAVTPIGQIQGAGDSAALQGSRTVRGVVVGDFEYPGSGSAVDYLRGFFVQNAPGSDDGDPATSDGIFVFDSNLDAVSLGQVVQVTGNVIEYGFNSVGGTITEMTSPVIEVCPTPGSVTPTEIALPVPSASYLERYEGMLVRLQQPLYVTEHYQLGRFGQVSLSGNARLPQPTNVALPGAAAQAQQAQNLLNLIYLDDELQFQNPEPIKFARNGSPLSASNTLRGGDAVSGLTGVLTQSDATTAANVGSDSDPVRYRVRPIGALGAALPSFEAVNARPSAPPSVPGNLKIAGFNLLNYFNTFGLTACRYGVGGAVAECRGADNASEFTRQSSKTVAAALGTGADVLVASELENDGYEAGSAISDLTEKLNAATAEGTWKFIDVDTETGQPNALGVDAIKVAMLYKVARVRPVGVTAVANTGSFGKFQLSDGSFQQRNRPALAQAFEELTGQHGRVVVVANHLKSKGAACDDNVAPWPADVDLGDGQGNCNLTRSGAAQQLVDWLAGNPTRTGEQRTLVMGDLNSYAQEDPIRILRAGGYQDLIETRLGAQAYSYVFDGQWGYLDHALASASLATQVSGVLEWHINADEPVVLDYNTEFKPAAQLVSLYAPDAYRASDHDPVIVGLNLSPVVKAAVPAGSREQSITLLLLLAVAGALLSRVRGPERA